MEEKLPPKCKFCNIGYMISCEGIEYCSFCSVEIFVIGGQKHIEL